MVENYLENVVDDVYYPTIDSAWTSQIDAAKCGGKELFPFQSNAVENAVKSLYLYYENFISDPKGFDKDASNMKLYKLCYGKGMNPTICDIDPKNDYRKFNAFEPYYSQNSKGVIESFNFFNRMCFWMATGSGKTVLLVKMIEVLDKLMDCGLIPKRDLMILFPTDKILGQFNVEVDDYNKTFPLKSIKVYSLKNDYATNKYAPPLIPEISVYAYRSDLLSEKDSKKRVSLDTYDNNGEWYVFVDEAHKGNNDDSKIKDAVTLLSRNGFLFNFSATFTDDIDYATTCKNYNLERFISDGYGKNVYLSESTFSMKSDKESDLSTGEKQKQKQVLKSLIMLTLIKLEKENTTLYHHPLMVTFVNSIGKDDSDLDLFFEELQKIIKDSVTPNMFDSAKTELLSELMATTEYQFGSETFNFLPYQTTLENLTITDVLEQCFNTSRHGTLEILQGKDKESEFALQVSTSDKPFALFRIGDAGKYVNSKLGALLKKQNVTSENYFNILNSQQGDSFNILIGSRMFYEGWDSNRPNVINYVNIGTNAESKKLILQSLGRGVRIEPNKPGTPKDEVRKRLPYGDPDKKTLLETLFVFATNRKAIDSVMETMEAQKTSRNFEERSLQLNTQCKTFDLLIPTYKEGKNVGKVQFKIARASFDMLKSYIDSMSDSILCLKYGIDSNILNLLKTEIKKPLTNNTSDFFVDDASMTYKSDMDRLLQIVIGQLNTKDKQVDGVKLLGNEIIHFKHIKIDRNQWSTSELTDFENFVKSANTPPISLTTLASKLASGAITEDEFRSLHGASSTQKTIKDIDLYKLLPHYYVPIILSNKGKLDYIKHIIDEDSEVAFVKNLIAHIGSNANCDWMFSKIDQTIDDKAIAMPYFNQKLNCYSNFFPDFIFWKKQGNDYTITFVDPKGTAHTDYQLKVDDFERMFTNSGAPKVFHDKLTKYNITFNLILVYNPTNPQTIPGKYSSYWKSNNDFSWL